MCAESAKCAESAEPRAFGVVILAAGQGTRMRSQLPKTLHEAAGLPLLEHVLRAVEPLRPERTVVVIGHGAAAIEERFAERRARGAVDFVVQRELLGTGHALSQAREAVAGVAGPVVVLNGDGPLVTAETVAALLAAQAAGPGMSMLTARVSDPSGLGRVLRGAGDAIVGIVEEKDASDEQRAGNEINPGAYVFDEAVFELCESLSADNAGGEYYITELIELYLAAGRPVRGVPVADEREILAVNNREELARADRALRDRTRARWLAAGVTMTAPELVFLDEDVRLEADVVLHPGVHLLAGTTVGGGAVIGPGAVLTACRVAPGSLVPANLVAHDQDL